MINFVGYSIDRLCICYKMPVWMMNILLKTRHYRRGFWQTKLIERTNASVTFELEVPKSHIRSERILIATLRIDCSLLTQADEEVYCWLNFDNEYLYRYDDYAELRTFLHDIENALYLASQNITKCELACDVTFNAAQITHDLIRNTKYDLIVLNKQIKDANEVIESICYELRGTRKKYSRMHVRIKGKDAKFQLYIYDKLQEIQAHHKEYILKRYQVWPKCLYRMEVRFDTDHYKMWRESYKMSDREFLDTHILNNTNLPYTWNDLAKKFIRFRFNRRHIYSVLEMYYKLYNPAVIA